MQVLTREQHDYVKAVAATMMEDSSTRQAKFNHLKKVQSGDRFVMNGREYVVHSINPKWGDINVLPAKGKGKEKTISLGKSHKYMVGVLSGMSSKQISLDDFKIGAEAGAYLAKVALDKKAKSDAKKAFSHDLKVGDHLYSSWGYDQTNVDFYQVVKVPSGKTVHVQKVGKKVVKSSHGSDYVEPSGRPTGKVLKKRVNSYGRVKMGHTSAGKWGGQPVYQTASGYGH